MITYIDDILTHSKGHHHQLKLLEETLLRLRKYNLKLNPAKSVFGAEQPSTTWHTTFPVRE